MFGEFVFKLNGAEILRTQHFFRVRNAMIALGVGQMKARDMVNAVRNDWSKPQESTVHFADFTVKITLEFSPLRVHPNQVKNA